MAEESVYVPIMPEIVRLDEVRLRSSEGKPIASKSGATTRPDPRRASTGSLSNGGRKFSSAKQSPLNGGESPVPHYLRASIGSCHDFCKFGRKHEMEVKPWQAKVRKVVNPTLNKQKDSEAGDLSDKKNTKTVKSKPLPVLKTNSPNRSAVFKNKISSPCNESIIQSRTVSAKARDVPVSEMKKNVTEKRNTPVLNGRTVSERKPDKTKGTSKEATRKVVSSPLAYLAIEPSSSRPLSLEVNENRSRKLVSPLKGQNKILKAENKHRTDDTIKLKTLHVIEVEAKKTVPELREKNQEGIKEVENELLGNEKVTDETLSVLKVDSQKIVPESKQSDSTFDSLPSESSSYPSISSPAISSTLSNEAEEAEDELDHSNREKKVPDAKQTESTTDIPPSESFSFPNISSPVKCAALSYGEGEAQDELEYTNSEKTVLELIVKNQDEIKEVEKEHVENEQVTDEILSILKVHSEKILPESKQNEITFDPPSSKSSSSSSISSPIKFPILSDSEEKVEDELEYNTTEKKAPEAKQNEATIDIPLSESFSSRNISSSIKSPTLSYADEEAQDELDIEYTAGEKKVPELEQNESAYVSLQSESFPSPNISSPVESPALFSGKEEAQDELEYLDSEAEGSDDSISESSETHKSDDEETSVGNQDSEIRKGKDISVENNTTTKLKFKRGKVVEIESNEVGPRRLRFQRARVLSKNQDNDLTSRRRRYAKGGVVDDTSGTNDDSEKVVLRHQEVEGKKDAQGLFNNVIEETASKLAEGRKSKVKALVGAFETVISLQETKPSTQAAP